MQIHRLSPPLVLTVLLTALAGCGDGGISPLEQVENGLSPQVLAAGQATWSLAERMEHYQVPGLSFAVIDDNEVVLAAAYGTADANGTPVSEETLFQTVEGSRLVAELAAGQLVAAGRLTLDGPINEALSSWKIPANGFTDESPVTLRQLLGHSGGVNVRSFLGYVPGDELPTLAQVLEGQAPANSPPVRVTSPPGGQARTSAGGFMIVQQALEDASGKPYAELAEESVLEPLGMTRSTLEQPLSPDRLDAAATGYHPHGGAVEGKGRIHPELAAAGLWTTPSELARVVIQFLRSAQGDEEALVPPEIQSDVLATFLRQLPPDRSLRLGALDQADEVAGFLSGIIYYPMEGKGAVVMTNSDDAQQLVWEVFRAIARAYRWPGFLRPEIEPVAMDAEQLDNFTGRYARGADGALTVTRADGRLEMRGALAKVPNPLVPVSEDTFVNQTTGGRITFRLERDGRAAAFTFRRADNNQEVVFPRLDGRVPAVEHLAKGEIAEGIRAYRQIDPPPSALRLNQVGYGLFNLGRFEAAARVFELSAELHPRSANVYDSLGEVYLAMGEREKAAEAFRQVQVFLLVDGTLGDTQRANLEARARYFLSRLED